MQNSEWKKIKYQPPAIRCWQLRLAGAKHKKWIQEKMKSGIFLASQISINIPAPGFGNRGRCNLKGEELGRRQCCCGSASPWKKLSGNVFLSTISIKFLFCQMYYDTAFKRTNYSMVQREYIVYISTNLCLEVTHLSPSLAVYPGVTQPQLESRNLSSIHSTSSIG